MTKKTEKSNRDRWRDKDGWGFVSNDRYMTNPIFPSSVIPTEIKMVKWRMLICAYHAAKFAEGGAESNAGKILLMQMYLCKILVGHLALKEINGKL